jgi:hypothetical protein
MGETITGGAVGRVVITVAVASPLRLTPSPVTLPPLGLL